MTTSARIALLAEHAAVFEPWTGEFTLSDLREWIAAELGSPGALDEPIQHGPIESLAVAPSELLHVVSGNTPHAAMQSLLRGLLVGSHNTIKLPSSGLPALARAVERLPRELSRQIALVDHLPEGWAERFNTVVIFGSDETVQWFRTHASPQTKLILHGQKLSIGLVTGDLATAARLAAQDVSLFDQQGCLSIHDLYLSPAAGNLRDFAELLAQEMEEFQAQTPRRELSLTESGTIASLREAVRFEAASRRDDIGLWESEGSTAWTVIFERSPVLKISPLNRVVYVKPWPGEDLEALGPARVHLSALALHPFDPAACPALLRIGASRLCPLGATQFPSLFWHHDGAAPLASLIEWVDLG